MLWNGYGGSIATSNDGLIENVYIKGFVQTGGLAWCHTALLVRNLENNGRLRNILVEATSPFPTKADNTALGADVIAQAMNLGAEISNVVLIGDTREAAVWAEGNTKSIDLELVQIDDFATVTDFTTANVDNVISNRFTSPYWDTTGAFPVLKPIA
jgi:hypothetical protein